MSNFNKQPKDKITIGNQAFQKIGELKAEETSLKNTLKILI